jgi:hypothetical protein
MKSALAHSVAVSLLSGMAIGIPASAGQTTRPGRPINADPLQSAPAPSGDGTRPGRPLPQESRPADDPLFAAPQSGSTTGSQASIRLQATAHKSGLWRDPATWGLDRPDKLVRPKDWPINGIWPLDPRAHRLDVFTGMNTVQIGEGGGIARGVASALDFSGHIKGPGELLLDGRITGRATQCTVDAAKGVRGYLELDDATLRSTARIGQERLTFMTPTLSLGVRDPQPISGPIVNGGVVVPRDFKEVSNLGHWVMGFGAIEAHVELFAGGGVRVTRRPSEAPGYGSFRTYDATAWADPCPEMAIGGRLAIGEGAELSLVLPNPGMGVQPISETFLLDALINVSDTVTAESRTSRITLWTVENHLPAGYAIQVLRSGGGLGSTRPLTIARSLPSPPSVGHSVSPADAEHMMSRISKEAVVGRAPGDVVISLGGGAKTWWAFNYRTDYSLRRMMDKAMEQATEEGAELVAKKLLQAAQRWALRRGMQKLAEGFAAVVLPTKKAELPIVLSEIAGQLVASGLGIDVESQNAHVIEAISVRQPELASGGGGGVEYMADFDNLVLVTHGTNGNCERSPSDGVDRQRETMGQLALYYAQLARQVEASMPPPPHVVEHRFPPEVEAALRRVTGVNPASPPDPVRNLPIAHGAYDVMKLKNRWQVFVLDWREYATGNDGVNVPEALGSSFNPFASAMYAQQIGISLADRVFAHRGNRPPRKVHLIAHSSGSWLIDGFADRLREHYGPSDSGGPEITVTFLDAFDLLGMPLGQLGDSADFAEHYFDAGPVPGTSGSGAGLPKHAVNIDVTALRQGVDGVSETHMWPYQWYIRTLQSACAGRADCVPCTTREDCEWREWGIARSPMFREYLVHKGEAFVKEFGFQRALSRRETGSLIEVVRDPLDPAEVPGFTPMVPFPREPFVPTPK